MNNKTVIILIVAIIAFAGGYFANSFIGGPSLKNESQISLQDDMDSLSYFIGLTIGYNITSSLDGIDPVILGSGINTVCSDSSMYDMQQAMMTANQLQQAVFDKKAKEAEIEGQKFLDENAKRDEVFVTESGLQYEPIVEGEGERPTDSSVVKVHYHGTFIDGEEFDSSIGGEPIEFVANRVIPGWTEGLQLMTVGSKYKFYIPYNLAYGARGSRGIPPYSTLIFEVELLSIEK